jgi:hypothetical protein
MDALPLTRRLLLYALLSGFMLLLSSPALVSGQEPESLTLNTIVNSSIDQPGEEQRWTISVARDDVLSLWAAGHDDFDPVLTIRNSQGQEVIANDDYAYPDTADALLEAVTLPAAGTYEIAVTGFGDATGEFTLTVLPGYAERAADQSFESADGWEMGDGPAAQFEAGSAIIDLEGGQQTARLLAADSDHLADFFVQTRVRTIGGRNPWIAGLVLRQRENGDYYFAAINQQGQWRLTAIEAGEERIIRNWNSHPVIAAGETSFRLGTIANGNGIEVFYNGQSLGKAVDDAIEQGSVGVGVRTADQMDSTVTAAFDELIITVPYEAGGEGVFPQRLVGGTPSQVVQELERRRLIAPGGQQTLSVSQSFVGSVNPGVSRQPLASGVTFGVFVAGTTASLETTGSGITGCGLLLHSVSSSEYAVAYLDNAGGYGVSLREGDTFAPGIFAENERWSVTGDSELLVIVLEDTLHYYVNRYHAGTMEIAGQAGEFGNVIVNFDPGDATCQFRDTWVWEWE